MRESRSIVSAAVEAGKIIDLPGFYADDVALGSIVERCISKRVAEGRGAGLPWFGQNREIIAAIMLASEKHRFAEARAGDGA